MILIIAKLEWDFGNGERERCVCALWWGGDERERARERDLEDVLLSVSGDEGGGRGLMMMWDDCG